MTTSTATPCALCHTTEGYIHPRVGTPTRTRGLCEACYIRERRAGHLDRWPKTRRPASPANHTCPWCAATFYDSPSTHRTYCSRDCYNEAVRADHPDVPTGIVTPAMIGITADEIAERCADAAYDLKLTESAALYRGLDWRDRHPEQFQPEALAALYPDLAGLAFSAWVENAEQRAA